MAGTIGELASSFQGLGAGRRRLHHRPVPERALNRFAAALGALPLPINPRRGLVADPQSPRSSNSRNAVMCSAVITRGLCVI
jgi:hypothetical protein